jgi:hypothetical protein
MHVRHLASLALAVLALVGVACAAPAPPAHDAAAATVAPASAAPSGRGDGSGMAVIPVVPLGQPFPLQFDHLVRAGDTGVRLRFAELLEDSRCPRGVQCIQAGRVRARLDVMPARGERESVELGSDASASRARAAGLALELLGVEPAREQGDVPRTDDYTLTLRIERQP